MDDRPAMRLLSIVSVFLVFGLGVTRLGATQREERFNFSVQPGCTLKVDTHRGAIIVAESDTAEVRVLVQMEIGADTDSEAAQLREKLRLDAKQSGNVVSVFARNPSESRLLWSWHEEKQIGLTYRITVPRQCNLDLTVRNGAITVGSVQGRIVARLEAGNFSCRRVDGSCDASVTEGDVVVSRCVGPLRARTRVGSIQVGVVTGAADVRTASGMIEIMMAHAALDATAEAGDVQVGLPRRIGGDATLGTHGGNILVKIDPVASCRIEASAVWGNVTCRLPVTFDVGANGKSRVKATLHEGGPTIAAKASGGYVRLEPGETLFE